MQIVRNAALPVTRWPNGAGRKADIATGDGWMVGFAWLDADAPFSDLPGLDRTITLVEGPGFTLDIAGRDALRVDRPFTPEGFDGGAETFCRIAGASRVLNIMTRRTGWSHSISIGGLPGVIDPQSALCFVVVLQGRVPAGSDMLGTLDAVRLDGPFQAEPGDGLIATIRIAAV